MPGADLDPVCPGPDQILKNIGKQISKMFAVYADLQGVTFGKHRGFNVRKQWRSPDPSEQDTGKSHVIISTGKYLIPSVLGRLRLKQRRKYFSEKEAQH